MSVRALVLVASMMAGCGSLVAGCGGGARSPGAPRDDGGSLDAASAGDGGVEDAATGEPRVYIHMRATAAPVPHAAGSTGQTPRAYASGIRSLELLRSPDDPSPVRIFSHGDGYVEASYEDGADTIVGSARIAELPDGSYSWGRAVHTHVRFTVAATAHTAAGIVPGDLDTLLVLSDRTTLDGVARAQGDYRFVFRAGGMAFPSEGSGYAIPAVDSGGFEVRVERGETAYYFPAPLEVRSDLSADVHLIFEVNTHESFRWTEATEAGYAAGTFDITLTGTEPIVQAGANSYAYFIE